MHSAPSNIQVFEIADACDRLKSVDIKIALNGVNHITWLTKNAWNADVVGIEESQV